MNELLRKLEQGWVSKSPPDLVDLVSDADLSLEDLVALVREDHRYHIQAGSERRVEDYLAELETLRDESSCLDLIYNEFVLREDVGQSPAEFEFLARFPQYEKQLSRQFQVHRLLHSNLETEPGPADDSAFRHLPTIDGFQLLDVAGHGAMGVVYKARDLALDRVVAIKMLLGGQYATDEQRDRLRRESALAAKLRHSGIVAVHQVGVTKDGVPFLVMEFVEGGTLSDILRDGPLKPEVAVPLATKFVDAIAYAHSQDVIHRDLKPANILMGEDGPQVTDFGLSRRIDSDLTQASLSGVVGTPQYMSPEQADPNRKIGPPTDVYSAGAVLYELLTGRPPLQASSPWQIIQQIATHEPPRLRELDPTLPVDLETICQKCLQKDAARRYQTASELKDDLRRFAEHRPIAARPVGAFERLTRWCRREPRLALAGLALAAMAMAISVVTTIAALRVADARDKASSAEASAIEARVSTLLNAAPDAIEFCIEPLQADPAEAKLLLQSRLDVESSVEPGIQFRAACGLASLGHPRSLLLLEAFESIPPSRGAIRSAVAALQEEIPDVRFELARRSSEDQDAAIRVRFACLAMFLGEFEFAEQLTTPAANPDPRTRFVHEFTNWIADADKVPGILDVCSPDLAAAICLGMGKTDPRTLTPNTRERIATVMRKLYANSPNGAVHSSADWALRKWGEGVPEVAEGRGDWIRNSVGMTLLRLRPGKFLLGERDKPGTAYEVELSRGFLIGDREVSCATWARFAKTLPEDVQDQLQPTPRFSPSPDCPIQSVSWIRVIQFCNWLSRQEGRSICYSEAEIVEQGKPISVWKCDFEADGYRLPTEAEWEYAARARAETRYSFGSDPLLESQYVRSSNHREIPTLPCGSLLPNAWGLFDMQGSPADPAATQRSS